MEVTSMEVPLVPGISKLGIDVGGVLTNADTDTEAGKITLSVALVAH